MTSLPRSPNRLGGAPAASAALSPSRSGAQALQSPGLTRLDRVLDLVTEHEAHYREQELRLVEMSKRLAACESTSHSGGHASGNDEIWAELRSNRQTMERLQRQVGNFDTEKRRAYEEMLAVQSKLEAKIDALAADFAAYREKQAADQSAARRSTRDMLEEVITRVSEQLKAVKAGAAPRGDVGALAGRLEDVGRRLQSVELQQQGLHTQVDCELAALREVLASQRNPAEAAHAAARAEHEARELRTQYAELSARLEAVSAAGAELHAHVHENREALHRVRGGLRERGRDVAQLADMVGAALRAQQAQQAAAGRFGAGSAIGALGFGSYAPLSAAAAGASASAAADREVEAFDAFVRKLHRRVGEADTDDVLVARRRHYSARH